MKNIYVCNTYFQVFITLIKVVKSDTKNYIVLSNTIPDLYIYDKIKQSNLFEGIFLYDEIFIRDQFNEKKIEKIWFRKNQMIDLFEKNSEINFNCYDNIYVYNDWTTIGAYLIDKKIKYHLIEDGVDAFYYIKGNFGDKVTFLNPTFSYKVKRVIKKILHIGYDFFGQSNFVIDIEVNDISKIFIKNKNVIEVKKEYLYSLLDENNKKMIYNIFNDVVICASSVKDNVLILTQPLYIDNMVDSMDVQIKIYTSIIKKYKGKNIYVKPHPRDDFDYKLIDKNIFIINKNIPIEVLNFNNEVKFEKAITITSSSIRSLKFVKEKEELGFEYLRSKGDV